MRITYAVAAVVMAAAVAGCSDSPNADPAPTVQATTTPAADRFTPETVATTPVAAPVTWYGRSYTARYADCAQRLWDGRVGQWNALSQAERDKVAGGSDAWMKSKGWPVTHEATLVAPATRKACPS